jgi:tRNA(Ile)-lysidine synthase
MARSHPPTLLTSVRRTLREECGLGPGDHVLVAVSGGGDSLALLHAMSRLGPELGLRVSAHGVDHGLRPEASAELELAARFAERCRIPFSVTPVLVEPGGNLQARARAARYQALRRHAEAAGAGQVATAHHADDRAETVLIRLLRGAGPRGLGVLPARSGWLVRPLVRVRKAEVLRHLGRHGIEYATDPSNRDRRFLRVRVRLDLMPQLLALSPRIVEHLNALADQILSPPLLVVGDDGHEVGLGRSHANQIRRAEALGLRGTLVRLPGGREVHVNAESGRVRLAERPRPR